MTFVCTLNDAALANNVCKLPRNTVNLWLDRDGWPLSIEVVEKALNDAARLWESVANLRFNVVRNRSDGHILVSPCRIDGSGKVLAWSEMPCSHDPPLAQCYDIREAWSGDIDAPSGTISLPIVMAHEIGHALGLPHGPSGNIMAPTYNNMVKSPGPWDIKEIQLRYGESKTPVPPEEPGMSKWLECLVKVLPQYLQCIFTAQKEAQAKGQKGPIDELILYLGGGKNAEEDEEVVCKTCGEDTSTVS
jgi:hypothetical protein